MEALSVGQQQRVEIIKAAVLAGAGGFWSWTEPTAVLTTAGGAHELEPAAVRALAAGGRRSCSSKSHKLGEVETLCDEVTILRQGRVVHHGSAAELSAGRGMAELMVGETVELPRVKDAGTSRTGRWRWQWNIFLRARDALD